MADEVIDFLRVQFAQVNSKLDQLAADVGNLKVRMSGVEMGLAEANSRLDRMDARIERIERRLDLRETA